MGNSAESGRLSALARAIYKWASGDGGDLSNHLLIREVFGSSIGEEELASIRARLENDETFLAWRSDLVARWRTRMASGRNLPEAQARALIGELADSFNHALLYDHTLVANSTYMRQGDSSVRDMRMAGTMPCWTVHLTTRGSALFVSRRTEREVTRGSMMLMRPDAVYHYGLHPREQEWEHLWALFQPRAHWVDLMNWDALDPELPCLTLSGEQAINTIQSLFRDLIALGEERGSYRNELQYNKLEEILIRAREYAADRERVAHDWRIQRACDYMLARLDQSFAIDDVAAELNLSPSRFAHLFKAQLGVGPKTWINDLRLQQARKLLLHTDDSIAGIGRRVGYDDPSHFSRYFSKSMGCSPRAFRRAFSGV